MQNLAVRVGLYFVVAVASLSNGCSRAREFQERTQVLEDGADANPTEQARITSPSCDLVTDGKSIKYEITIKPLMAQHCDSCHGEGARAAAFARTDVFEDLFDDQPTEHRWSQIIDAIREDRMPRGGLGDQKECVLSALESWRALGYPTDSSTLRCDDDASPEPSPSARSLNRLSRREYFNTLKSLLGDAAFAEIGTALQQIPADIVEAGYENLSWSLNPNHVDSFAAAATAASVAMTSDLSRAGVYANCLNGSMPDEACVLSFISEFGRRAFRRPLDSATSNELMTLFRNEGGAAELKKALAQVVSYIFQAPEFLYKIEVEGVLTSDKVLQLDDYGIASRLSFALIGTGPDIELLNAARDGLLKDPTNFEAQARRLVEGPGGRAMLSGLIERWLQLERIEVGHFSPRFAAGISSEGLKEEIIAELKEYLDEIIWNQRGAFSELMTSHLAFPRSPRMRRIYGLDPNLPDGMVTLQDPQYAGLLTKAALLIRTGDETSLVKRGGFALRQILCEDLQLPDPNVIPPADLSLPTWDPRKSARERWTDKTGKGVCAGCHLQLNPLGFPLEAFDNLGRSRTHEEILDSTGAVVNHLPIDFAVTFPRLSNSVIDGPAELGHALGASVVTPRCFARQWLRYQRQVKEEASDTCLIRRLVEPLAQSGEGVPGMMLRSVLDPSLRAPKSIEGR